MIFNPESLQTFASLYPARPGKLHHTLSDHPLLNLPALVELGQRHPAAQVEYNVGDLPLGIDADAVGKTGLSVAETIRRIEECGSWMVIKHIENDAAYRALLNTALAELEPAIVAVSGQMLTPVGFIFVSSPNAVTPFHLDPEHNVLLHCRGTKTMMIVPGEPDVVPDEKHETYHIGGSRNVPWNDSYAERGEVFELAAGDAVHVPLMWPHWVKNGPSPSVSLSITWRTKWSYEEADARAFNALLRRRGLSPRAPQRFPLSNRAKSIAWRTLRKVGVSLEK